ncbi:MAG: TIR domain-containing protein [Nitrosospira sp.]
MRIFICYRKMLSRQENGERIKQKNTEAEILNYILCQSGAYDPWVDTAELAAGMKWETKIYRELLASDVLLVLVGPGTAQSEWVRREIALATALGISIVPVGFDLSDEEMIREAKELLINDLQWMLTKNIRLNRADALLAEVKIPLMEASEATRERQKFVLGDLWDRRNPAKEKAPDDQKSASYRLLTGKSDVLLHVASGDMMKIKNVDVFVNSENDYMQMARFFESRTISSMLRHRGARIFNGCYQDTIQQELDWNLRDRSRPVYAAEVFATSAGGPTSELSKVNKARSIIHVAAVQSVDAAARVIPYKEPHQIEAAVRATLAQLAALNNLDGVFSPQDTDQRLEQEARAKAGAGKLRSIAFPLLGTGQGGAKASEVIEPILDALIGYLSDDDNSDLRDSLRDVYVSAYSEDDVSLVKSAIGRKCEPATAIR